MYQKLNPVALANTFGVIDLILHPLFHLWVSIAPKSYEFMMNLFVAGLHLEITHFDSNLLHIAVSTIAEASVFWVLGFTGAKVYNFFVGKSER